MAASTSKFIAGHYTATYGNIEIGATEDGFHLEPEYGHEDIISDELGVTVVDGIFRGYNLYINFDMLRFTDATTVTSGTGASGGALLFPFITDVTKLGILDSIGKPLSDFANPLVLTPIANINSNLKTYTFAQTVPRNGHAPFALNTKLRKLKCMLRVLPVATSGVYSLFTVA